jgi:hypothetical protein
VIQGVMTSRCLYPLTVALLSGCTSSNPPPPAYSHYPPPQHQLQPPPPQPAPVAPAADPVAPAPQPAAAVEPPPPPALDASSPCIDGSGDISNEFDGAAPLTAPSTTVVCIGKRDQDTFTITAPGTTGASLITYEIKQLTDDKHAAKVTVFDNNRKKELDHNGRRSEHLRGYAVLQAGTSMYLRLALVHPEEGKLALKLDVTPIEDPNEPNDTRETAKPVSGQTTATLYRALNNPGSTSDWYTFEVAKPGPVAMSVDMSEGLAAKVTVMDANKKVASRKAGGRSERLEWSWNAKTAGTYQVEVASVHPVPAAGKDDAPAYLTKPYTLTVSQ